jgi:hypothetical protein
MRKLNFAPCTLNVARIAVGTSSDYSMGAPRIPAPRYESPLAATSVSPCACARVGWRDNLAASVIDRRLYVSKPVAFGPRNLPRKNAKDLRSGGALQTIRSDTTKAGMAASTLRITRWRRTDFPVQLPSSRARWQSTCLQPWSYRLAETAALLLYTSAEGMRRVLDQ